MYNCIMTKCRYILIRNNVTWVCNFFSTHLTRTARNTLYRIFIRVVITDVKPKPIEIKASRFQNVHLSLHPPVVLQVIQLAESCFARNEFIGQSMPNFEIQTQMFNTQACTPTHDLLTLLFAYRKSAHFKPKQNH